MSGTPSVAADVAAIGRITAVSTILQVIASTTGLRFSAVARVTETSWTACAVHDFLGFGLQPGGELAIEETICREIRQHHQPMIFSQFSVDSYRPRHPLMERYGVETYVSIPIFRTDGEFFGTLCAFDSLPARLDESNIVRTFELFAQLIAAELEAQERLEHSVNALLDAQQTAQLRDQFIAVLGHDLRNPLAAVKVAADLLHLSVLDTGSQRVIGHIQRSCDRMTELIRNILDFARGKLGGGIPLTWRTENDLAGELWHVIGEVQQAHSGHTITTTMDVGQAVTCDASRIAQLLVNLLTNALVHGAPDQPVSVSALSDGEEFELSVLNQGQAISEEKIARLFKPFAHVAAGTQQSGLGLGLYISAEIAKAHHGTLQMSSSAAKGTRFVFRMPLGRKMPQEASRSDVGSMSH